MIPLKDILPSKSMPAIVFLLIAANAGVWVIELLQGRHLNEFVMTWGFTPLRMLAAQEDPVKWVTPLSSMFMHGGWLHIIGNMWFLWIFGDNVEDAFGHAGFIAFYLACGLGAAAMQFLLSMNSPVPMVGASGAISGVLGAYACFFPRARIVALVPIFDRPGGGRRRGFLGPCRGFHRGLADRLFLEGVPYKPRKEDLHGRRRCLHLQEKARVVTPLGDPRSIVSVCGGGAQPRQRQQGGVPAKAEITQNEMAFVGCNRGVA
jgi:membrane associated rhomboid family serine protease